MRTAFSEFIQRHASRDSLVFLTGDLGFMAFEGIREAMGDRFINAGVAEQNMVSVAAGLARGGLRPWVYSIAPFIYARPFEQIRNDVCLHGLPVILVGNGGGYGYGAMGATHHAIEDYGALLTLRGMQVAVPAFAEDIAPICGRLLDANGPTYLRLGMSEKPSGAELPEYSPWRRLVKGKQATVVVAGSLVGGLWAAVRDRDANDRPSVWVVSELPVTSLPSDFTADIAESGHLVVVEEHVAHGGLGMMLAHAFLDQGLAPAKTDFLHAKGYPSGLYGSQKFHRAECGLTPDCILEIARKGGSKWKTL